jgi:hypothetical protein
LAAGSVVADGLGEEFGASLSAAAVPVGGCVLAGAFPASGVVDWVEDGEAFTAGASAAG